MLSTAAPDLLHVVGYVTGAALYAMLLAMVVRANREGCRRIDVSPLSLADADKGTESAERGTAGVVGVNSAGGACFQFHGESPICRLVYGT